MRGTLAEITKYGGEWTWDLQIGETPRVATEVYLPVGYRSRWFVAPHVDFNIRTLPVINDERPRAGRVPRAQHRLRCRPRVASSAITARCASAGAATSASRACGSAIRILPAQQFDSRTYFGAVPLRHASTT